MTSSGGNRARTRSSVGRWTPSEMIVLADLVGVALLHDGANS
jgi:hypothetical protein